MQIKIVAKTYLRESKRKTAKHGRLAFREFGNFGLGGFISAYLQYGRCLRPHCATALVHVSPGALYILFLDFPRLQIMCTAWRCAQVQSIYCQHTWVGRSMTGWELGRVRLSVVMAQLWNYLPREIGLAPPYEFSGVA